VTPIVLQTILCPSDFPSGHQFGPMVSNGRTFSALAQGIASFWGYGWGVTMVLILKAGK